MSHATAHAHAVDPAESPLTPESWGKLGMWIFLAGDAMSFGALLAGYGALRSGATDWPNPLEVLGINLTAFMTFLLICSSVTMVKALSAVKRGDQKGLRNFLALTILGGLIFLGLQAYEWTHLMTAQNVTFTSNPYGSYLFGTTFYAITGFHGAHVTGGVIYLSAILMNSLRGRYSAANYNGVENVGLYWHFVDLVWILVFTFVYLIQ
ncbi:cytochrome c oxidase subunit 3 [bacterium]|nr:MAG: cytochrome oxidase subunit III [candidate division KSB1 bacterium]MCE7943782.1 cytochrome oxidase subunit III [Chlorobi bacterium CHB1]MCL4704112.1 cytochrome c oxidase subunit 3 [bacterium]MDL1875303.1 cytochrome oxidase subunit III [Cytophagia bacterium CHB2]MBC6952389.1 cytochrome oxidase subunit III [candidate division KSB1 bacterium]